jgi:hypothetical protein
MEMWQTSFARTKVTYSPPVLAFALLQGNICAKPINSFVDQKDARLDFEGSIRMGEYKTNRFPATFVSCFLMAVLSVLGYVLFVHLIDNKQPISMYSSCTGTNIF